MMDAERIHLYLKAIQVISSQAVLHFMVVIPDFLNIKMSFLTVFTIVALSGMTFSSISTFHYVRSKEFSIGNCYLIEKCLLYVYGYICFVYCMVYGFSIVNKEPVNYGLMIVPGFVLIVQFVIFGLRLSDFTIDLAKGYECVDNYFMHSYRIRSVKTGSDKTTSAKTTAAKTTSAKTTSAKTTAANVTPAKIIEPFCIDENYYSLDRWINNKPKNNDVTNSTQSGDVIDVKDDENTASGDVIDVKDNENTASGDVIDVKDNENTASGDVIDVKDNENTASGDVIDVKDNENTASGDVIDVKDNENTASGDVIDVKDDENSEQKLNNEKFCQTDDIDHPRVDHKTTRTFKNACEVKSKKD